MTRVLHTAQALVDITIEVPNLPTTGTNVNANSLPTAYAGGAVNILVAAARTGAKAVHGGAVGEGRNGDLIRQVLALEGVELSSPKVAGKDSGSCYVLVEPSAERSFVTCYGAERDISVQSLSTLHPTASDLLCISGYSFFNPTKDPLLSFLDQLPAGVVTVLDPGDAFWEFPKALQSQVLSYTRVWTSNLAEAEAFSAQADPFAAADLIYQQLLAHGTTSPVVIVRDGPQGCFVKTSEQRAVHIKGFPQRALDTNGAGDTHTGILLGYVSQGMDFISAAKLANAGAALKVVRKGQDTWPRHEEIMAFIKENDNEIA